MLPRSVEISCRVRKTQKLKAEINNQSRLSNRFVFVFCIMTQSSLDATARKFAREHLGESEEVSEEAVRKIEKFLAENSNINGQSDERTILRFLRSCKFNVEQTQKKITK